MRKTVKLTVRRQHALDRLEKQLKSGVKPAPHPDGGFKDPYQLEEKDVERIKKEIDVLKSRV